MSVTKLLQISSFFSKNFLFLRFCSLHFFHNCLNWIRIRPILDLSCKKYHLSQKDALGFIIGFLMKRCLILKLNWTVMPSNGKVSSCFIEKSGIGIHSMNRNFKLWYRTSAPTNRIRSTLTNVGRKIWLKQHLVPIPTDVR